jgi:predicted nucleic acid-binding Zn ribbon protein
MTDAPLTTCPECGAQIRRILFPTGIVFKGHGFYKTDHTSNGGSIAANSNGHTDNKKAETEVGSNDNAKKSEAGSNGNAKKAEGSTSTSPSESKSAAVPATK